MILDLGHATRRYEIRKTLGEGATGIVFEAYDRQREARVALKVLRHVDPAAVQAFKAEFRSLADVRHENVVDLFDLVIGDGAPFFTMELVLGCDFLAYVRAGDGPTDRTETRAVVALGRVDEARFARAARQLARGLATVHAAGILHRDIKPSNVLVDAEGRVVIVDFGIAVRSRATPGDAGLVGTPSYMAPEIALGETATAACDWYAAGTMLFEALAGRLPFEGVGITAIEQRLLAPAPRLRDLRSDVSVELDDLCAALLDASPLARPTGAAVVRRLALDRDLPAGGTVMSAPPAHEALVGRAAERAALDASLVRAVSGAAACVVVRGASGMGKSSLVRSFVDEDCARRGALVLEGRCYERESVPYKGVDAVLDALVVALFRLREETQRAVIPERGFDVLCRLFPVLERLHPAPLSLDAQLPSEDPQQMRSLAFGALRELFERLARVQPVVVILDDIQWGDADSALLLPDLAAVRGVLLIFGYRTDVRPASPQLAELIEQRIVLPATTQVLTLAPLATAEAELLVRGILGESASDERVARVLAESDRTPFFLCELAHFARASDAPLEEIRLGGLLTNRLEQLPARARALLEVAAVAGKPTAMAVLRGAADLGGEEAAACGSALGRAHLLRSVSSHEGDKLTAFHDRIREAVVAGLGAARTRDIHARLAAAHEASGHTDAETLFEHHHGGGNTSRAAEEALRAGERAESAFAADRAAHFYAFARDLLASDDPRTSTVSESLGRALSASGHGREAADAFLAAAVAHGGARAFDLQRRASEELLLSGHVDRGIDLAERVLAQVGMELARTWWQAVLSLLFLRLRKWLGGMIFHARDASPAQQIDVERLDVAYGISTGLLLAETVRGTEFAARSLLLAMRAGEPGRAVRALAVEGGMVANEGDVAGAVRHFEQGWRIAVEHRVPDAMAAILDLAEADARLFTGNFRGATISYKRARERYGRQRAPNRWELTVLSVMSSNNRAWLGEWPELDAEIPVLLRDAADRGDRILGTLLRVCETNMWWLVRDDPAGAREALREGLAGWTQKSFRTPHAWAAVSLSGVELYEGNARAALACVEEAIAPMRRVFLLRFEYARVRVHAQRGVCAVATALSAPHDPEGFLRVAVTSARKLERERSPMAHVTAALVRGGVASARGLRVDAAAHFQRGGRLADDLGMELHAAAAQRRVAELVRDGRALAEADARLRARGVRNVERMAFALCPFRA